VPGADHLPKNFTICRIFGNLGRVPVSSQGKPPFLRALRLFCLELALFAIELGEPNLTFAGFDFAAKSLAFCFIRASYWLCRFQQTEIGIVGAFFVLPPAGNPV